MQSHVCGLGWGPVLALQFYNCSSVATPAALGDPGNLAATATPLATLLGGKHQAAPARGA